MECGLPRKIGMQPLYFVGFRRCPLVISAPNGDENTRYTGRMIISKQILVISAPNGDENANSAFSASNSLAAILW